MRQDKGDAAQEFMDSGTLFNNLIDKRIVHGSYSLASFGFSVERGESIVKKVIIQLKDKLLNFKRASRFRALEGLMFWVRWQEKII